MDEPSRQPILDARRLLAGAAAALVASGAAAAPQPGTPLIDNPRVSVWRATLARGETGPATPEDLDAVVMFLDPGRVRTVAADGTVRVVVHRAGDAAFVRRGVQARDTVLSAAPVREVVVALKDSPSPAVVNDSGLPPAFPRAGSVKVLENDRVVVWRSRWTPGRPTPMHFHDKDVVVAYRYDAELASTTPDGKRVVNRFEAGEVRFNPAKRVHSELLVSPRASAVMTELK